MSANKMWGGRFTSGPAAIMEEINTSIGFDKRLAAQDLAGSQAHAAMLAAQGIIAKADAQSIAKGLTAIGREIEAGSFPFRREFEDIHMNVEARLAELIGAAALAGTPYPIDRKMTAKRLGFARAMRNSLDAVSARDFALEFLAAAAIAAAHLSRLAEEIVLWASPAYGFVRLSDAFSTGSSIMPQKRNPDAAELVRAKVGRILGGFVGLLTVLKGLPLAYAKDLQEDKEPVFAANDALELSLSAMAGMVAELKIDAGAMRRAAEKGYPTATDLADWMVRTLKKPFRQAHRSAAKAVARAESLGVSLDRLPIGELKKI